MFFSVRSRGRNILTSGSSVGEGKPATPWTHLTAAAVVSAVDLWLSGRIDAKYRQRSMVRTGNTAMSTLDDAQAFQSIQAEK